MGGRMTRKIRKNYGPSFHSSKTARRPRFLAAFTRAGRSTAKLSNFTMVVVYIHGQNWGRGTIVKIGEEGRLSVVHP